MIDILLIYPPVIFKGRYKQVALGNEVPPHSLIFLGAVLRENNFRCEIMDANILKLDPETVVDKILDLSPKFVGFTAPTMLISTAAKIADLLKKRSPDIVTIVGGPHITALPEKTMTLYPDFDIGVIGEGEITIIELLQAIQDKINLNLVKGIIFRENNSLKITDTRPLIKDLDILPFPAWDMLPGILKDYQQSSVRVNDLPNFSLVTSRGCPFRCIFCFSNIFGQAVRGYSADYLIRMIKYVKEKYKCKSVTFEDDNFVINRKRLVEFCNRLIDEKVKISWDCGANVSAIDEEILPLMKRAGCWQINFGIESGSQRILDFIKKRATLAQIKKALKLTRENGINTKGYFIIGHPTETQESIQETANFIKNIDLDVFQMSFMVPFPGTELYEIANKYGEFKDNWDEMNIWTPLFIPTGFTKEKLENESKKVYREFYLKQPQHILKFLKRALKFVLFKKFIKEGLRIFKFILARD